jgi:propionyl-CoA carboxylase alpha chain
MADQAYCIGPPPAEQSYLDQEAIVRAAQHSEADAVHPGYGFLSENPAFARKCRAAGLIFIGPTASAIEVMGDKTAARSMVEAAGVPVVPGTAEAISDPEEALRRAREIGFPVLIKAAAGGGGKGMRVVEDASELADAMDAARRESQSAFGDARIFLERYLQRPRHIEFQILGDSQGHVVHLFERECSIQRRHQKVIEEAPSPFLTPELRTTMGEAAVRVAKHAEYTNAGTVEFIVTEDESFYFLEMNTRLQVEHPVTEEITGIDLVEEQIRIAAGAPLSIAQDDIVLRGHALESRIYAEDPANGFLPDSGTLYTHRPPAGPGVRVDAGVEEGMEIGLYYDPMIAKVITWASDRSSAMARMDRALGEYEISGLRSTISFCRYVMNDMKFSAGEFSTRFIPERFDADILENSDGPLDELAAVTAALLEHKRGGRTKSTGSGGGAGSERNDRPGWRRRRWSS